jgi:hypothetical protein
MSGITREQIMTALVTWLTPITAQGVPLKFVARRVRDPENVPATDRPCIYLVERGDEWEMDDKAPDTPAIRILIVAALIYTDVGTNENAIPATQLNYFIEAIENAFLPDDLGGSFTLGDTVRSAMIAGNGLRASGDTTSKSLAVVPIRIVIP